MLLLILAIGAAVLDWVGVAFNRKPFEYTGKPAVIILLLIWFVIQTPTPIRLPAALFLIALLACLVGDILLMVPGNRFVGGLAAFLVANLLFIAAFNAGGVPPVGWGIALAAAATLLVAFFLDRIRRGLQASVREKMFPAVAVYGLVLGGMVWSAFATPFRPGWPLLAAWLLALGGMLSFASDLTNVWNRFLRPVRGGRLTTHVLYHLGQLAMTGGMLLYLNVA